MIWCDSDRRLAGQARLVARVIAVTMILMILWIGAEWRGGAPGLPAFQAFLFQLMALAAVLWTLAMSWTIRRRRRE